MLLIDVVRKIFALEDAVSFNFALGAPHIEQRVKSRRPASVAPNYMIHCVWSISAQKTSWAQNDVQNIANSNQPDSFNICVVEYTGEQ